MPKISHAGPSYYGEQGHVEDALGRLHELDPTKTLNGDDTPGLVTDENGERERERKDDAVEERNSSPGAYERGRAHEDFMRRDSDRAQREQQEETSAAAQTAEKEEKREEEGKEESSAGSSSETSSASTPNTQQKSATKRR